MMKNNFNKYSIVSFDIFGTLVLRNVKHPHSIFNIVEKKYNFSTKIENFSNVRIKSEIAACQKFGIPTLDEIYQILCEQFPSEIVERYKKEEIKWEELLCMENPDIKKMYEKCVREGKRIIIVSDMYLPRFVIEKILLKCGIKNYEKLYISSELKISKHNGELFRYILDELAVSSKEMIHIGDNIRNDYINPKFKHIDSCLIFNIKRIHFYKSLEEEILDTFLNNKNVKKDFWGIGYNSFGPLLYGYTTWLHKSFKRDNIDHALFFSRDGYFMQKTYSSLYNKNAVPNSYFYASRRLFLVATLWMTPELSDVIKMMYLPRFFTVRQFIESVGINEEMIQSEIKNLNLDLDYKCEKEKLLKSYRFAKFYSCIKNKIIENSKCEYKALIHKLSDMDLEYKNLAIVDIGWIGNMQKCFEMIINKSNLSINIKGYYLGVDIHSGNQKIQNMNGYLYQKEKNESFYSKGRFIECIYELFFMAPHGTALYYKMGENEIEPVCKKFEYENTRTFRVFSLIQKGAECFVKDFAEIGSCLDNNELIYSQYVIRDFLRPTCRFSKAFGEIKVFTVEWCFLASPAPYMELLLKPSNLYKEFTMSIWKPGYLRRLFRIPLPYDEILGKLYELLNFIKFR